MDWLDSSENYRSGATRQPLTFPTTWLIVRCPFLFLFFSMAPRVYANDLQKAYGRVPAGVLPSVKNGSMM